MTQTYEWQHGLEIFIPTEIIKTAIEYHPAILNQIEIVDIKEFTKELAKELLRDMDTESGSIIAEAIDKAALNIIESGHESVRFKLDT